MKMNHKKEMLFGGIVFVLCVLLFLQRLTGDICHAVFGMVFGIVLVTHMCRKLSGLKHTKWSVRLVDIALLTVLAVAILSGILLHPLHEVLGVKILHKLSAVLVVVGILVHVVQHKNKKDK